jgi:hypothetical protein
MLAKKLQQKIKVKCFHKDHFVFIARVIAIQCDTFQACIVTTQIRNINNSENDHLYKRYFDCLKARKRTNSLNLATQNITIKNETTPHPVFITAHSFQSNY